MRKTRRVRAAVSKAGGPEKSLRIKGWRLLSDSRGAAQAVAYGKPFGPIGREADNDSIQAGGIQLGEHGVKLSRIFLCRCWHIPNLQSRRAGQLEAAECKDADPQPRVAKSIDGRPKVALHNVQWRAGRVVAPQKAGRAE